MRKIFIIFCIFIMLGTSVYGKNKKKLLPIDPNCSIQERLLIECVNGVIVDEPYSFTVMYRVNSISECMKNVDCRSTVMECYECFGLEIILKEEERK